MVFRSAWKRSLNICIETVAKAKHDSPDCSVLKRQLQRFNQVPQHGVVIEGITRCLIMISIAWWIQDLFLNEEIVSLSLAIKLGNRSNLTKLIILLMQHMLCYILSELKGFLTHSTFRFPRKRVQV